MPFPRSWLSPLQFCPYILAISGHAIAAPAGSTGRHPLSIDEVLNEEQFDRASLSPDGKWVAAVIRRGAHAGEVYGRASYDIDPTRADVWLISTETGVRRPITLGAAKAAGFWCATWSPDGRRLAMLSTLPEGREPRGGDNVRVYVWDRATGAIRRMTDVGVVTQTRYGEALNKLDLRGGADHGTVAHLCSTGSVGENAPFLWLDDHRLLVATLPKGEISAAIDNYDRPSRIAARDATRLHDGIESTASVVASGSARSADDTYAGEAILRIVDVSTRAQVTIASVPAYPFHGSLAASVSPDGKRLAIFPTVATFQPKAGRLLPNALSDDWLAERRLGFVELRQGAALHWASLPVGARYPLKIYGWSLNGHVLAFRARSDPFSTAASLFVADAKGGQIVAIGQPMDAGSLPSEAIWVDDSHLVTREGDGKWMLSSFDGARAAVSGPSGVQLPEQMVRAGDRSLIGFAGKTLVKLDAAKSVLVPVSDVGGVASFKTIQDPDAPVSKRLISVHDDGGHDVLALIDTVSGAIGQSIPSIAGDLLDANTTRGVVLHSETRDDGIFLRQTSLSPAIRGRQLLSLDTDFDKIDWGETRLIKYKNADGVELNASAILPPGYSSNRRYPTLVWVYSGYQVPTDSQDDCMISPWMAGIYNLHLYAARGYVVLVPSVPLDPAGDKYGQIPKGVFPAIDKLVALGIADPTKLGVFGQSDGGYSVYALVGQTNRFKAAVAIAGVSDLTSNFGEFDPTARGYPGIDHEKSGNWTILDRSGLHVPPWRDPDGYARNSPLSFVDRVNTPLLMIHGDLDIRGAPSQAERFFYGLYMQGKTAEFVRYGGESHSLAQSPATVRDVFNRTIAWFDHYLTP